MPKNYLITASKDHIINGVKQGIAQAGHGRHDYMARLCRGDRLVYYAAKEIYGQNEPWQKFTALGEVVDDKPYQPAGTDGFRPWRRKVKYMAGEDADIRPLVAELDFIRNKKNWGLYVMGGMKEISEKDFMRIEKAIRKT